MSPPGRRWRNGPRPEMAAPRARQRPTPVARDDAWHSCCLTARKTGIPRDAALDNTLAMYRERYEFIAKRWRTAGQRCVRDTHPRRRDRVHPRPRGRQAVLRHDEASARARHSTWHRDVALRKARGAHARRAGASPSKGRIHRAHGPGQLRPTPQSRGGALAGRAAGLGAARSRRPLRRSRARADRGWLRLGRRAAHGGRGAEARAPARGDGRRLRRCRAALVERQARARRDGAVDQPRAAPTVIHHRP